MKVITSNEFLSYQGERINYVLKRREQKNIILKLDGSNIVLSAPFHVNTWEVERLIYKNIVNIKKYLDFVNKNKVMNFETGKEYIKIFGKSVPFTFVEKAIGKEFVFQKYETVEETVLKTYNRLSTLFKEEFANTINKWAELMGLSFKNLTIKSMKGKWGVCYPTKSKIVLNIRLIHYDKKALDYVCVHELSHLLHSNHSKDFWYLVEKYLPNYKEYANILKNTGWLK